MQHSVLGDNFQSVAALYSKNKNLILRKILRMKTIPRKILRISVILRIKIFVNRKILILRIFLRKRTILRKIPRIRIFLNTGLDLGIELET